MNKFEFSDPVYEKLSAEWRVLSSLPKDDLTAEQWGRLEALDAELTSMYESWFDKVTGEE